MPTVGLIENQQWMSRILWMSRIFQNIRALSFDGIESVSGVLKSRYADFILETSTEWEVDFILGW
jgi:hypothetical protein